jgi:hypothetical protein
LDSVGGRRAGPAVEPGRRKSKCSNPIPQAKVEDNEYHRVSERNARYEEVAGRVKSNAYVKARKTDANGTPARESNADDCAIGGGEEEHGASTDRVRSNDLERISQCKY